MKSVDFDVDAWMNAPLSDQVGGPRVTVPPDVLQAIRDVVAEYYSEAEYEYCKYNQQGMGHPFEDIEIINNWLQKIAAEGK